MSIKSTVRLFNDNNNQPTGTGCEEIQLCDKTISGKHIWQPFAVSHSDVILERCLACALFNF